MLIEMAHLFNRDGASIPVELTEQLKDTSDYPDVVEFVEPVKIEGTLKNENSIFVLEAKGSTAVMMRCDRCLAPVRKELCFEIKERFAHTGREDEETETFSGDQIDLADFVKRAGLYLWWSGPSCAGVLFPGTGHGHRIRSVAQ